MTTKRQPLPPHEDQQRAFIEAARAAEVDEDEKRWEARLKAVVKPAVKPAKKGKQRP